MFWIIKSCVHDNVKVLKKYQLLSFFLYMNSWKNTLSNFLNKAAEHISNSFLFQVKTDFIHDELHMKVHVKGYVFFWIFVSVTERIKEFKSCGSCSDGCRSNHHWSCFLWGLLHVKSLYFNSEFLKFLLLMRILIVELISHIMNLHTKTHQLLN